MTPIRPRRLFRSARKRKRVFSGKKRKRIRTIVRRQINKDKEWKWTDTVVNTTVSTSGAVSAFINPSIGTGQNDRIGEAVTLGSIRFWYYWLSSDVPQTCRFIVFQWYPQTTPTVSSILDTLAGSAPYHHYDTNEADNYKILLDRTVTINANDGSTAKQFTSRRIKIKPGRRKANFLPSSTASSNRVWMLYLSDSSIITHPSFYLNARMYFRD